MEHLLAATNKVVELNNQLTAVTEQRDEAREDAERWKSLFDAMERAGAEQARRADKNREWALKAERELTTVTEQRDRLAEALRDIVKSVDPYEMYKTATTVLPDHDLHAQTIPADRH